MAESKSPPKDPFVNAELMEGVANFRPLSGQRFQFYVIRALERLETQMRALLGNGRPGSIERLSARLRRAEVGLASLVACAPRTGPRIIGRKGGRNRR